MQDPGSVHVLPLLVSTVYCLHVQFLWEFLAPTDMIRKGLLRDSLLFTLSHWNQYPVAYTQQ